MNKSARKWIFGILGILFFLNLLAWLVVYDLSQPQFLEVTFFDIGQGDAIFIETPQRYQILIDGGPDATILEKLGKEMPFYDRTIDLLLLSHPEHDHMAGLLEVLKRYKVENILWTGVLRDTSEFKEWQRLIKEEKANIFIAQSSQTILFNQSSEVEPRKIPRKVEILFPFESLEGQAFKNTNNTSIIVKLVFGENSFLFTGDAYKSVEKELIRRYQSFRESPSAAALSDSQQFAILDSDVLKVGHHGSKTSSAEEFIAEVSPEIAVIQAGLNNPYGHPRPETLETLEKYGITIFRTDEDGDIKITSNEINYEISSIQN